MISRRTDGWSVTYVDDLSTDDCTAPPELFGERTVIDPKTLEQDLVLVPRHGSLPPGISVPFLASLSRLTDKV